MKLPEWLESNLPAVRPVEWIRYANGKFFFRGAAYDNVVDAYEAAHHDDNADFAPSVIEQMDWTNDAFYTVGNRLLVFSTDQEGRWLLEESFKRAVEAIYEWRNDKANFKASYYMLDTHPAFWTRHTPEPMYDWSNWGNVSDKFWFAPTTKGMMMECGAHVEPDYTDTYHDLRLDTFGESFEDCIIQTAALVDKFFHEDGTERENVEYEKSELELTLESRISEWKAQND